VYKNKVLITAVLVCLAVSVSNAANTIYIDANGTGEYPTIQDAVNDANHGDVIVNLNDLAIMTENWLWEKQ
jgi:hypothetical protein